ncbi:ATP-citrate synthase beta chain protein 1 [Orobanche minor]
MSTKQAIDEIVGIGYVSGLFVLARAIGLIGHTFDQKRLKQPIYRHPPEDVLYTKCGRVRECGSYFFVVVLNL